VSSSTTIDSKIINHPLRLSKDGADDYMITSVPQELRDSHEFEISSKIGIMSTIFISRKDGRWDSKPLIVSKYPHNSPLIKKAMNRLHLFMYICDKTIPDEEVVAVGYYADYNELLMYLHSDLWKNKAHYEEVIKKLNNMLLLGERGEII